MQKPLTVPCGLLMAGCYVLCVLMVLFIVHVICCFACSIFEIIGVVNRMNIRIL